MFRVLFLILILTSFVSLAQAQESSIPTGDSGAYIFAELEKANNTEVKKRVEEFYKELKNQTNFQGYIINYGTGKEVARREKQFRSLMNFRDYDAPKITFVRGGNNKLKSVFWIVPASAESSKP